VTLAWTEKMAKVANIDNQCYYNISTAELLLGLQLQLVYNDTKWGN